MKTIKTLQMRCALSAVTLGAALACTAIAAKEPSLAIMELSASDLRSELKLCLAEQLQDDQVAIRTTVKAGDAGYEWARQAAGRNAIAEEVMLEVRYPIALTEANPAFRGNDPITALTTSAVSKSMIVPEGPPPYGNGSALGNLVTTISNCGSVTVGTTQFNADISYTWRWENTVDSDGDGSKDSEPGWVLKSSTVTFLLQDAQVC